MTSRLTRGGRRAEFVPGARREPGHGVLRTALAQRQRWVLGRMVYAMVDLPAELTLWLPGLDTGIFCNPRRLEAQVPDFFSRNPVVDWGIGASFSHSIWAGV
jgi:hypothetical protein